MKRMYVAKSFRRESLERIELVNSIVEDYSNQGLRLTLRQLYYQLVSKNVVPNTEKSYKNLGSLVSDARYAGLVDWDAIEDRNREPVQWAEYESIQELIEESMDNWRMPRWAGQSNYVELWVEKAALAGVLRPLAAKFHVTLMVNRGYSSSSAMYESANRFKRAKRNHNQNGVLFYLGDHDPSGEDMVRDIADRFNTFRIDVDVRKLALTMDQVREYDPPPNPAKMTDSRAAKYVEEHGAESWEVDALNPKTLSEIITEAFTSVIDQDQLDTVLEEEEAQAAILKTHVEKMMEEINETK
jgi:hypothetical protein